MKKLNIAQICFSNGSGGLEIYLVNLSMKLKERGHNLLVVTLPSSFIEHSARENQIEVLVFNIFKYIDISGILKIRKIIKNYDIDIIHSHQSKDIWNIVPSRYFLRKKKPALIYTRHFHSGYPKRDFIHKWFYKDIDLFIANSELTKNNLIKYSPVEVEKVKRVYYAVDLKKFDPEKFTKKSSKKNIIIGTIGRIEPMKGQKEFILASLEIAREYPDAEFVITGSCLKEFESYEKELRKIVEESLYRDKFHFLGRQDNIPKVLSEMDIFVMPSYEETFGIVLIEAMAMGIAVIGTNTGGVPEIISDGEDGLLVEPRSVISITRGIKKLIADKNLFFKIKENARKTVKEKFNFEKHIEEIENFYYTHT